MFGGAAGARGGRAGGSTFEFDTGGVGVDLDLQVSMSVSLEEAVKGGEKRVRLPTGKELNVKIPAGVSSGQQIRLKGQGETAPGHRPGDVLISVSIAPHPFFKVDGSDLRIDLPITLYEATEEHPAQTQLITEDVIAGQWLTIKYSGAIAPPRKKQLLARIEKLSNAVKFAREQANAIEATEKKLGREVFDYLFAK